LQRYLLLANGICETSRTAVSFVPPKTFVGDEAKRAPEMW